MRFGARVITSYCNSNDFSYGTSFALNQGENSRMYLQLADLNQKLASDINGTVYQRYMPPAGSSLQIVIAGIDDSTKITRYAIQDTTDPSLWYIDFLPTDVVASGNIHLTFTESGGITRKGVIMEGLTVYPTSPGSVSFC
jgi:hypothetical protein